MYYIYICVCVRGKILSIFEIDLQGVCGICRPGFGQSNIWIYLESSWSWSETLEIHIFVGSGRVQAENEAAAAAQLNAKDTEMQKFQPKDEQFLGVSICGDFHWETGENLWNLGYSSEVIRQAGC